MPKKEKLRVYLDHLIQRDSFLYRRVQQDAEEPAQQRDHLTISSLYGEDSVKQYLRKPDFQRSTWAWSPEDCVSLLDSVLNEQVVPSVIMWLSPDNLQYVLDGGHRISVLLAWMSDDWGDRVQADRFADSELVSETRKAARRVRELLIDRSIGSFEDHQLAARKFDNAFRAHSDPNEELSPVELARAKLVRRWKAVNMGFPILWVKGDHETAEKSFLKINKSGRRLSDWETKFVENRSSAFARAIMSVAIPHQAERCWPAQIQGGVRRRDPDIAGIAQQVVEKAAALHDLLFKPPFRTPVSDPRLPLMGAPFSQPELKPAWISELLTITEGSSGSRAQTEKLLRRGLNDPPARIVTGGLRIIKTALDAVGHLHGPSPRSLALAPLVYYYNAQGVYVRSLLYGMLFWLNSGNDEEKLQRKLTFAVYRKYFEHLLLEKKSLIVARTTRRIGSGTEVTQQTARYYNGLLSLLMAHAGEVSTDEFSHGHEELLETLGANDEKSKRALARHQRTFRGGQRTGVEVREFLASLQHCEICGGRFYPGQFTQIDHVQEYSAGGFTTSDNGRSTHPFCNNNRRRIQALQRTQEKVTLPKFEDPTKRERSQQLSFLSF